MQSFSYPINAVYYYYIPLETVLMFVDGVIYGKAVHGISTEKDVAEHEGDFIKLPQAESHGGLSESDPAGRSEGEDQRENWRIRSASL